MTKQHTPPPDGAAASRNLIGLLPLDAMLVTLFWLVVVFLFCLAALVMNNGVFTYTMDDPYIHLAVAEELARGNYGVNPDETCAPCSSLLWPFLLVPFVQFGSAHLVPLFLNLLCGLLTGWLALGRVRRLTGAGGPASAAVLRAGIVVIFLLATNWIGLAFTGMEHNLQLLLAVVVVEGMLRITEKRPPGAPFYIAMIIGPWVRYENLALTAAGSIVLLFSARPKQGLACVAGAVAGLAGFSGFLMSLGLSPIPSSIKAKSNLTQGELTDSILNNLLRSLGSDRGMVLAIAVAVLIAFSITCRKERSWRLFAGAMAAAGMLHLLFGAYGWVNRYEVYMLAALLWALFGIAGRWMEERRDQLSPRHAVAFVPLLAAIATPYLYGLHTIPLATNNIYEQQYQMHRFAKEFWKQPVAVNDLGYVSFRNDQYVLDLFGLASARALAARTNKENPEWMSRLAAEHDVKLAMIYDSWFPELPEGWIKVGKLRLSNARITPASSEVSIFAIGAENSPSIQSLLRDFRKTLPQGVVLETRDEALQ